MIVFPNAKINLGLNIVAKRTDGYHDLETVFYPLMVKDVLEVIESKTLQFTSSGMVIPGDPKDNICIRAFDLLARDLRIPPVHIHLHKNIPMGAGLGGGSADASFLLKLLNERFDLGLDSKLMESYAAQLGADCPFFIQNKPVFATGTGNMFEPIDLELSQYYIVVVMPELQVATAEAFNGISPHPSKDLRSLIQSDISTWKTTIVNDFETGIIKRYPQIGHIKAHLYSSGAIYASMSGSGSAVYGIFSSPVSLPELQSGNNVFYGV